MIDIGKIADLVLLMIDGSFGFEMVSCSFSRTGLSQSSKKKLPQRDLRAREECNLPPKSSFSTRPNSYPIIPSLISGNDGIPQHLTISRFPKSDGSSYSSRSNQETQNSTSYEKEIEISFLD